MSKSEYEVDEGIQEISPDGRFIRYDDVLGSGAFKVVYTGLDQENGKEVAWSQICIDEKALDSPHLREILLSEATLLKSVEHDNIIKCHSSWVNHVNKNINMITELFNSGTLRQYRKKHKSLDTRAIKIWGRQILKGLHYLHSHDPPIIHRDLKCDNIFVNGNHGEVKIGDLGMATMINRGKARSVLGTPEFMAPELYDEEYNELVDIYSFGMCMLELATCEYPYRECKNQAQIFKKVTTGVKPLAHGKIKDPLIKELIEKCLVPASQRMSAAELLKDPFFSSENTDFKCDTLALASGVVPKSTNVPKPDSQISLSIGSSHHKLSGSTSTGSINEISPASTLESWRSMGKIQLRLKGKRIDHQTISFNLQVADLWSPVANSFEFSFDLEADDALKIAMELVQGKDLSFRHVPLAVELMDSILLEIEPGWKPCYGYYDERDSAYGCKGVGFNGHFSSSEHCRAYIHSG